MSISPIMAQAEQEQLTALEATIGRSLTSYRVIGQALAQIKARKLYRCTHRTWARYTKKRWNMSERHADRLIDGAQVAEDLERAGLPVPLFCSALPLVPLKQNQHKAVWRAALDAAGEGRLPGAPLVEGLATRALGKPLVSQPAIAALVPAGRPRQLALLAMTLARARDLATDLPDGLHLVALVERAVEVVARMPQRVEATMATA
jgi:hypothetical protein